MDARLTNLCPISAETVLVRGLRKRLGATWAVDGLDLDVRAGEVVGLTGANGAGKTTLLHLLAGVLRPDAGTIEIAGGPPSDPRVRRAIGFAPQATAIYDALTVEENLTFFARLHGLRGSLLNARVDEALRFAGLIDRRANRASTLSGGMKRRLHVASAVVHAPALLLLDEPTVGVDAASREHIVRELSALGCAILYASHHQDEVARLCTRTIALARGRVVS
jgi:ABC-2 type transport system ATP-binding protein